MPFNMNTGRFRLRGNCNFVKNNQSMNDLRNCVYYPCGIKPERDYQLVRYYKNNINRGLEHIPYLEKKSCIQQQRRLLKKKPLIINRIINSPSEPFALARLNNF